MGSQESEQAKVLPGTDCPQQPPASRTWQRRFDDEGKKVAMFSMTMSDLVELMPLMVKILKLQVEENAEGRVGYQTLSRIIVFLSLSLSLPTPVP